MDIRTQVDVSTLVTVTKPSSSEYRTRSPYSTVSAFGDFNISTPFYTLIRVVRVLPLVWKQRLTIYVGETLNRQRQPRQLGSRVMGRVPSSVASFPLGPQRFRG